MKAEISVPTKLLIGLYRTLCKVEEALDDSVRYVPRGCLNKPYVRIDWATHEEIENLTSAFNCALLDNDSHPDT
jgi:hypothetical protein